MSDSIVSERQKFKRTPVGNIPVDWAVKSIGELAECVAGGTPKTSVPEYWNGDIRWMNSGELNLKQVSEVEGRITAAGLENSNAKIIPAKCVLIGLAGQGKTRGTVAMNLLELCTNQSIAAILPNPAFVTEYLYYNLDFRYDELRRLSGGDSGRGGLNLSAIRSLLIPLPPIPEQHKIAAILHSLDNEIKCNREKLNRDAEMRRAVIELLLRHGVTGKGNPQWRSVPLIEAATLQRGIDLPVQSRVSGVIPIYGSNGLLGDHNSSPFKGPGVITGRSGTIGRVFYADGPYWPLNTTLHVIDFHGNLPRFIKLLLEFLHLEHFVASTGVPSLNRNSVHPHRVLIPSRKEQEQIVAIAGALDETIELNFKNLGRIIAMRKSIQGILVSGKIRPG